MSNSAGVRLSSLVPHEAAVHPEVERRVDAVEGEEERAALPFIRHGEGPAVGADGLRAGERVVVPRRLGGHPRRIGLERVVDVDEEGTVEALELPVRGDLDLLPGRHVELRPLRSPPAAPAAWRASGTSSGRWRAVERKRSRSSARACAASAYGMSVAWGAR
jgi:hypothetical protein